MPKISTRHNQSHSDRDRLDYGRKVSNGEFHVE